MRILSIDPGFERVGIALIERSPKQKDVLLFSECFKTNAKINFDERLLLIGKNIEMLVKKYKPETFAIEKLYFTNNQKTAMNVAEVRGMLLYIAKKNNLSVFEYTPPQIKVAVTGYGKADKGMVMDMVPKLIEIKKKITSDDEFDAIAIGITCLACEKFR
jgi:crossover junction endodeoxyribonuclease RuvC